MSALADKYGHRGSCLLVLGVIWVLFGISVMIDPQEPRPFVLHEMLPAVLRGFLWISSGLIAVWFALRGADRDDTWGMVALVVLPVERLVSFAVSWVAYIVLGEGYDRGWYAASVWLLIVVLLRIISGWPNPRRVLPIPTGGQDSA